MLEKGERLRQIDELFVPPLEHQIVATADVAATFSELAFATVQQSLASLGNVAQYWDAPAAEENPQQDPGYTIYR
jgi:hypothetical protein